MVKKLNVLVVGGTGFIGKNFIYNFRKKKNWNIYSVSRKLPKKSETIPNINYKKCDILIKKDLSKLNLEIFNYIIYAIGPNNLGELKSKKDLYFHKQHYLALKRFIVNLDLKNLKKFIFFGSSEEYGFLKSPHNENQKIKKLKNPYGMFKYKSTIYLKKLYDKINFPVVVLRVYLTYGPFQRENRLIPEYLKAYFNKKKIYVTSGKQKKNFLFISDLIFLIQKCLTNKKANGEIFNVGSKKPILLNKIFLILKNNFKINPRVDKKKIRISELINSYPNISKAEKILNWRPKIDLLQGLKYTVKYFKKKYRDKC
jgi:nucleoside-diphosphate-sugar epimerase